MKNYKSSQVNFKSNLKSNLLSVVIVILESFTALTTNTRPIPFKRVGPKLRFGGRQSKKSRWNYFEALQDSKTIRQEIENFTSPREGKSCLN